jgi:hypothetical protein
MITTPVRPLIAGEKVGERKGKEGEEPEETDDRGEKDAEEEREFAEVFARCRCAVFFRPPQQEPARRAGDMCVSSYRRRHEMLACRSARQFLPW